MLNSFPKFETRDLPGVKIYLERKGELPQGLVFGLAAKRSDRETSNGCVLVKKVNDFAVIEHEVLHKAKFKLFISVFVLSVNPPTIGSLIASQNLDIFN